MTKKSFLVVFSFILLGGWYSCTHEPQIPNYIDPITESEKFFTPTFTAYKQETDRTGVSGSFDDIDVYKMGTFDALNPYHFLKNARFSIRTNSVNIENNELKSSNVRDFFFRFMTPTIYGQVLEINNDVISVHINMNFINQTIDFQTTELSDSLLILEGSINDMNFFNWGTAYEKLNEQCGIYHGNHLWKDISLKATFRLNN